MWALVPKGIYPAMAGFLCPIYKIIDLHVCSPEIGDGLWEIVAMFVLVVMDRLQLGWVLALSRHVLVMGCRRVLVMDLSHRVLGLGLLVSGQLLRRRGWVHLCRVALVYTTFVYNELTGKIGCATTTVNYG